MFEFLFKYPREDYARAELVFTGEWPSGLVLAVGVIAAVAIGFLLFRRRGGAPLARLVTIATLQSAVIGLVLLLVMQPALRTENLVAGQNDLALLLDTSASMAYGSGETRIDAARRALDAAATGVEDLSMGIRRYEFADDSRPVDAFTIEAPAGERSALVAALLHVLGDARSAPLAAVVIASDGIDTAGGITPESLAELATFGVPVFALPAGRTAMPEDLELSRVSLPSRVLPGSTVPVSVAIRHDGGGSTNVKLYDGDELLASEPVVLRDDAATTNITFDVDGLDEGPRQLEVRLDPVEAETELRNNRRVSVVRVEAERRRILYFEGEPRWEYKFLRRAVHDEEQLDLATLLQVSPNKFYRQGIETAAELEAGFPATREALFAYDAVIIGSVPAAMFTPEQLANLRAFVSERGGSLLLLAGPNGLGNGGWGQSRIADVLPAGLPPSSTDSFKRSRVPVALTPQGADVPLLRLAGSADVSRAAWRELPDIADYQLVGALKPAAITLLDAVTADGNTPLLMTQPFGRGHSWMLATGGTWRWQMSLPSDDLRHETFWRQLLRALVAAAPRPATVTLRADGNELDVRAEFLDAAYRAAADIDVIATLSHESGEALSLPLRAGDDGPAVYRASVAEARPGAWFVEAIATRDGEPVAMARSAAYATPGNTEYMNIRADRAALEQIAAATGGQMLDGAAALADSLRYTRAGITETVDRSIWDAPAALLLLLGLKACEWLLRRRWKTI